MRILTLPNCLSLSRVVLAPPTAWALVHGPAALTVALFGAVVVSDLFDGPLARRRQLESRLGTLLDHGADAVFVITLSATGAWLGVLPPVLPPLIALAFAQYALDARALGGSALGRWNGIAYFVLVGALIGVHQYTDAALPAGLLRALGWVLVASTLASMLERGMRAGRTRHRS